MSTVREYDNRERAWIWLSSALGTRVRLTEEFIYLNDGLLPLFDAALSGGPLRFPESMKQAQRTALIRKRAESEIDAAIERALKAGAHIVTRDSEDYPYLLREIYDPPTVLFVKGRLRGDVKLPIAVIGSRKCSDYGREVSEHFGRELAGAGVCVVSGMAAGCDSAAAWGALSVKEAEYPTIAVLGSGVDIVYPPGNERLYGAIAERGAVISELEPGKKPSRESFPQRNRIISGISKGVLVTEAGEKSGTSITVGFAHDQGRDVFAVPGRITDVMCRGSNRLIKDGEAKAVFGIDDILYEYGAFVLRDEPKETGADRIELPAEQRKLYDELVLGEKTADELCEKLGLEISGVNIYLTEMELSGIIKRLPSGKYSV